MRRSRLFRGGSWGWLQQPVGPNLLPMSTNDCPETRAPLLRGRDGVYHFPIGLVESSLPPEGDHPPHAPNRSESGRVVQCLVQQSF